MRRIAIALDCTEMYCPTPCKSERYEAGANYLAAAHDAGATAGAKSSAVDTLAAAAAAATARHARLYLDVPEKAGSAHGTQEYAAVCSPVAYLGAVGSDGKEERGVAQG
jgi:hypothetical protein